jgi:hypothetical protein
MCTIYLPLFLAIIREKQTTEPTLEEYKKNMKGISSLCDDLSFFFIHAFPFFSFTISSIKM